MVRSPFPYSCNLNKLLPKVLVSTQSAPAARYFRWIVFIHSGRVRVRPSLKPSFLSGKSSGCGDNFWISVPIAPSKRITGEPQVISWSGSPPHLFIVEPQSPLSTYSWTFFHVLLLFWSTQISILG